MLKLTPAPTTLWNSISSIRRKSQQKKGEEFLSTEDEKTSEPSLKAKTSTQQSKGISEFFDFSHPVVKKNSTDKRPVVNGEINEKCDENGNRQEISFKGRVEGYFYKIRLFFNSKGEPTQLEHSDEDSTIAVDLAESTENQKPGETHGHLAALNRLSKAIDNKMATIDAKLFKTPAEKKVRVKLIELSELIKLTGEIVKQREAGEQDWVKDLDPELKGFLLKEEAELTLEQANSLLNAKLQKFATPTDEEKQAPFYKAWNKFLTLATTMISATCCAMSWGASGIITNAVINAGSEELRSRSKEANISNEALVEGCARCLLHLVDGNNDIVTQLTNSNKAVSSEVSSFLGNILTGLQTTLLDVQAGVENLDTRLQTGIKEITTRTDDLAAQQSEIIAFLGNDLPPALQNIQTGVKDVREDVRGIRTDLSGIAAQQEATQEDVALIKEILLRVQHEQNQRNTSGETLQAEVFGQNQRKRVESFASSDSGVGKSPRSSRSSTPNPMARGLDFAQELFESRKELFEARENLFKSETKNMRLTLKTESINLSDESKIDQVLSLILTQWAKGAKTFYHAYGMADEALEAILPQEARSSLLSEAESYYGTIQKLRASYLVEDISQEEITKELLKLAGLNASAANLTNTTLEKATA